MAYSYYRDTPLLTLKTDFLLASIFLDYRFPDTTAFL